MKLPITIQFTNGDRETYTALPPEWMKWEQKNGTTIQSVSERLGISDLMFLAYHAMKREAAGKTVKPFEVWCESVTDIDMGASENPKATNPDQ
tara:strand:- start:5272 stop:5550 length:279 start_codon:yes stop_codon:yes gene_type:complete